MPTGVYIRKRPPANKTHGLTNRPAREFPPELKAYYAARARCGYSKHKSWPQYGGRGIKFLFVSFEEFYAELGPKPTPKHKLDRIDNDGHYEPGNVKWSTQAEQNANKRVPNGFAINPLARNGYRAA